MNRDPDPSVIDVVAPVADLIARVSETFLCRAGGGKGGMERVDARRLEDLVGERPALYDTDDLKRGRVPCKVGINGVVS